MTEPSPATNPPARTPPGWAIVWTLNGLCLGAAFAVKSGWTGNMYVRKLAPNWEYTLGNWWSAMLLLAFAMLAARAAQRDGVGTRSRWSGRILSWLGAGLCLDELGSLHERASDLGPLPGIWNLAPFAAVFLLAAAWSLWAIWQGNKAGGSACILIAVGFTCLGIAEPLDMIEHAIDPPAGFERYTVVLEEGAELLGSTLLIVGALRLNHRHTASPPDYDWAHESASARWLGRWVIAGTIPLLLLREYLQHNGALDLHTRGDFGTAPAVMLLAMSAWIPARHARRFAGVKRWHRLALAGLPLLASVELGCNLLSWITRESVSSPLGVWWAQAILAGVGYLWLIAATRLTPARGSSPAGAA